jgi:hypothetical protein
MNAVWGFRLYPRAPFFVLLGLLIIICFCATSAIVLCYTALSPR